MNIFRTPAIRTFALALALPLIALFLAACEVGSVDSTSSIPSDNAGTIYNFAGLYMSPKFDPESTNALPALVYPNDATVDKGHVSILAPVGSALLGLSLGQSIDWSAPDGRKLRVRVTKISYQPEASGDLHR